MTSDEARGFNFTTQITDASEVKCNACSKFSKLYEWLYDSVYCETCGDHDAMVCPKCDDCVDYVFDKKPMEIR